jgi:hypothetical protein
MSYYERKVDFVSVSKEYKQLQTTKGFMVMHSPNKRASENMRIHAYVGFLFLLLFIDNQIVPSTSQCADWFTD